ncbi:MAG: hypothetical protein IT426_01915 [Pirellulales bacterium]|nr:hypothetical protein [Pirellulales bacterium]
MSDDEPFQNDDESGLADDEDGRLEEGLAAPIDRTQDSAADSVEIENFLSRLMESGLLKLEEVDAACKDFFAEASVLGTEPSFDALCEFLITTRRLTEWQCNLLKDGRTQGFFLDGYELLNDLGPDETASNFLAQKIGTNRRVKLRVTPIMPFPFPVEKPQYEVEEL